MDGRVFKLLLSKGQWVATWKITGPMLGVWAGRVSCRASRKKARKQVAGCVNIYLVETFLCAAVITALLMIGGVEQNPGPVDNIVRVLCKVFDRNLESGTQCDCCGQWYHNSCGNVKVQASVSGKWICDKCRSMRFREMEDKLRAAQAQIEELTRKNKELEEKLRSAMNGEDVVMRGAETDKSCSEKCLVLGDCVIRNVEEKNSDMRVKCFPGIKMEQLRRVIDNRNLGGADAVILHIGKNDVRSYINLDYFMGDVYNVVTTAKTKFPDARLIIVGVLRSRGVSWRRVGAANGRLEWVAGALGATFVYPNRWIRDDDFGRDAFAPQQEGSETTYGRGNVR